MIQIANVIFVLLIVLPREEIVIALRVLFENSRILIGIRLANSYVYAIREQWWRLPSTSGCRYPYVSRNFRVCTRPREQSETQATHVREF